MATASVPVHGNYHGYYLKRPTVSDPRLALLPLDLFKNQTVLDVGCNEGWVTCEIAQNLHAKRVVGVDIDESLIRAAWRRRRLTWSLQGPETPANQQTGTKRKRQTPEDVPPVRSSYFPAALEHSFGPLPIPSRKTDNFPHNITFRAADWVKSEIPEDKERYDIILGLSITKWIHLNDGDEGIRTFFHRVHSSLNPGGHFVLEPQDWENYSRAKRLDKKLKDNISNLRLRPNDFESLLHELGFSTTHHHSATGEGGFQRPITIYTKL